MSLYKYLQDNNISYEDFGDAIGVTATSVYRYATGERFPKPPIADKIEKVSGGVVTFQTLIKDFKRIKSKRKT